MNKDVVVIGANEFQLPLVLKAKQRGFFTHVFAWREGAVAAPEAYRFYPISITNIGEILDFCRGISPVAVVSVGSDLAAITVNRLANALGLPSNPPATASIATNKFEMRGALKSRGVPTPAFCSVGSGEDAYKAAEGMRLPIIVKPTDRSGSRGVTKLDSLQGLPKAVEEAIGHSFEKRAIIEEFAEGEEYSCECISQNGVHHVLAVTKKFTTGAPHFIETGHIQPAQLDDKQLDNIRSAVFAALDALQVTTGASHTEFKLQKDGSVFIIECGARMGGDCIGSDLVELSTGYDYLGMTLDAALGNKIELMPNAGTEPRFAAIRFIFNKEDLARLEQLRGDPKLKKKLVRVSDICMGADNAVGDSSARFGFYIIAGDSYDEAAELAGLNDIG